MGFQGIFMGYYPLVNEQFDPETTCFEWKLFFQPLYVNLIEGS